MEEALRALLLAQGGVAALLGTRLYPTEFPQNAEYPGATYQIISAPRAYTHDGPDGVTTFRVQLRIRATTPKEATDVRDAITASGANGAVFAGYGSPPVRIQAVFVENEVSETDPPLQPGGVKLYGMRLDLVVTANVR